MSTPQKRTINVSQQKKDQCNAKAQEIVLNLIDGVSNESEFLEQLRWINRSHYQDVTEERAIIELCGYPVCDEKLGSVPKKKYHISLSHNKVYDITERKLFCSNQCYKASAYLKAQLLASPLWVPDREENRNTFVLMKCRTQLIGEEVNLGIERVKLLQEGETDGEHERIINPSSDLGINLPRDEEKLKDDHPEYTNSVQKQSEIDERCLTEKRDEHEFSVSIRSQFEKNSENVKDAPTFPESFSETERVEQNNADKIICRAEFMRPASSEQNTVNDTKFSSNDRLRKTKPSRANVEQAKYFEKTSLTDLVSHVEQSLREWITVDTLCYILGDETVAQLMREKGQVISATERFKADPYLFERYNAICKKLKILELVEERQDKEMVGFEAPTRPLPDYDVLKEQTLELELKVKAFYRGDKKVTFTENKNKEEDSETGYNFLPPLHQHSQNSIRRSIVLDRLKFVLPDLCEMLGLRYTDVTGKVKRLIFTCQFSAHNITFKPVQWNLCGLVFLKLLSVKDCMIRKSLEEKSKFVKVMLMSYQLESNYLDCLYTWLTGIEYILNQKES